jgi:cob(I)alamin adenosyltransferase
MSETTLINKEYVAGSGDKKRITKVHQVYGAIDNFQAYLGGAIRRLQMVQDEKWLYGVLSEKEKGDILVSDLMWLLGKLTDLGSWAYWLDRGKPEKAINHGYTVEMLEKLEKEVKILKPKTDNCVDFFYFFIEEEEILNSVRVKIRGMELICRELIQEKEVNLTEEIMLTVKVLNRLSEYYWVVLLTLHKDNKSRDFYRDKLPQKMIGFSACYK